VPVIRPDFASDNANYVYIVILTRQMTMPGAMDGAGRASTKDVLNTFLVAPPHVPAGEGLQIRQFDESGHRPPPGLDALAGAFKSQKILDLPIAPAGLMAPAGPSNSTNC